jgi:hypothetical protein
MHLQLKKGRKCHLAKTDELVGELYIDPFAIEKQRRSTEGFEPTNYISLIRSSAGVRNRLQVNAPTFEEVKLYYSKLFRRIYFLIVPGKNWRKRWLLSPAVHGGRSILYTGAQSVSTTNQKFLTKNRFGKDAEHNEAQLCQVLHSGESTENAGEAADGRQAYKRN